MGVEHRSGASRRPAEPSLAAATRAAAARPALPITALTSEESLLELQELAWSAGATVIGSMLQRRDAADPATLIGRGKLQELHAAVAMQKADLVIFDHDLSPTQQRNLERTVGVRVVDRTQLILDIFARHARTREGQLQVELAQLEYLLPRLAGRGIEMSRLGGGIGTRGPGETQLETDRRRIHRRIRGLKETLNSVRQHRDQQRKKREAVPLATVALVGYTNAGKSSLFNRLTGAEVLISGRMFATLDPTLRAVELPSRRRVLLSDTVGFLRNLPHGLISAFRATLEEVRRASLLLVVCDATSAYRDEQRRQVQLVLEEMDLAGTPQIEVWNKSDLLAAAELAAIPPSSSVTAPGEGASLRSPTRVLVSALTGAGLPLLLQELDHALELDPIEEVQFAVPHPAGRIVHLLHEHGQVMHEEHADTNVQIAARVPHSLRVRIEGLLTAASPKTAPPAKPRRAPVRRRPKT